MFGVFGSGPPLSFGHFSRTAGETLPPVRPVTLTLALSHRGRGDVLLHHPGHTPLASLRLLAPPYALRRGQFGLSLSERG